MTSELPVTFQCQGDWLVGVLATAASDAATAVVIVVGGPQYRVGSHRQFVQLARHLAQSGYPALRFDIRGMGDSTGDARTFEAIDADIRAAIDALQAHLPAVRRVVLWGLCDGASAAMMYAPHDSRVAGLVLANPWARGADTESKTLLSHYYLRRALSPGFWRKLLSGKVDVKGASVEVAGRLGELGGSGAAGFRERMTVAMERFAGPALVLLSERDITGREFEVYTRTRGGTAFRRRSERDTWVRFAEADHTFSGRAATQAASQATVTWLERLAA